MVFRMLDSLRVVAVAGGRFGKTLDGAGAVIDEAGSSILTRRQDDFYVLIMLDKETVLSLYKALHCHE